jgi:hypothetical protein
MATNEAEVDSVEERAQRMGWVPKEDFRGDEEKWVDADKFVERADNEMPILRERNRKLDKELADVKKTMKDFTSYHQRTEERAYKRAKAELESKMTEAVKDGDVEAYTAAQAEVRELEKDAPQTARQPSQQALPEFEAWKGRNDWYGTDFDKTREANEIAEFVAANNPPFADPNDFYAEIDRILARNAPSRRDQPSRVAGAGDGAASTRSSGKQTYANLPAEAKRECDRFVAQGLLTKEAYVKEYEW